LNSEQVILVILKNIVVYTLKSLENVLFYRIPFGILQEVSRASDSLVGGVDEVILRGIVRHQS
jgi:hypothetical protein